VHVCVRVCGREIKAEMEKQKGSGGYASIKYGCKWRSKKGVVVTQVLSMGVSGEAKREWWLRKY
jgi:hypothetical protein